MKYIFLLLFVFIPALQAHAAEGTPWEAPFPDMNVPMTAEGEVLTAPLCFRVINDAPYMLMGSLYTNYYTDKERRKARHTSNFRLEPGQSQPYCSYGPFYEGQKLDLVLRSLVPLFSCRTAVHSDIHLKGEILESGGTRSWATCHD
ncbi:MAG: hypothetical protein HYS17_00305 [Micavibrio aeruginosavorus]|uniref:Uncharacterized protein n=1 Tax=Micavibrio aeruginosavorus TaxID=349221 RepID=A0A7T5R2H2_9BACT|nr:MAG: hypothetical protein HYS17_00305 [Micavibrio aeruginosavorus]